MATTQQPSDLSHQSALRRRRRLLALRHVDRNRPLQILALLLIYLLAIHYIFKFAAFHFPSFRDHTDLDTIAGSSQGVRGGRRLSSSLTLNQSFGGVMGFSFARSNYVHHHHQSKLSTSLHSQSTEALEDRETATETTTQKSKRQRIPLLSYKDDYVIVSKPAGMTMHHNGNSRWGRSKSPVLETTIKKQLSRKPYLVHRLDHRTSGALLLAFNSEMAASLHGRLRSDESTKLYVALVRGDLREKFRNAVNCIDDGRSVDLSINGDGSVTGSCGRIPNVDDDINSEAADLDASEYKSKITVDMPIKIDDIEKDAQTDFFFLSSINLEEESDNDDGPYVTKSLSLLLCQPKTGRTHQIRRHAIRALQSPIIGDSEHGDSRVNRFWREEIDFNRLGLHCFCLDVPPISDEEDYIKCIAPLTEEFRNPLECDKLAELWEEAVKRLPALQLEPYDERGGTFGRNYRQKESGNAPQ